MIQQKVIQLKPRRRGFHLVTDEILEQMSELPEQGLVNFFIRHTSAGLTINENCDPTVRSDFNKFFDKLVPENEPYYDHTAEGSDDMPAHIKSTLTGHEVTIPIQNKMLALGTWQGIYLCEFRNSGGARKILVSIYS